MNKLKEWWKEFFGWVADYPAKAIPYIALVVIVIVPIMAASDNPLSITLLLITAASVLGLVLFILAYRDIKRARNKLLTVLICARLMAPLELDAQLAQPKSTAIGVGVGVLIGGTVIVVIYYNLCKKVFNKPTNTNDPPELFLSASGGGDDSYAAVECWFDGYCSQNDLKGEPIDNQVVEGGVLYDGTITAFNLTKEKDRCSVDEFRAAMASHGVPITQGSHYAKNGIQCDPSEVPVTVSHGTVPHVQVRCDGPTKTIVIERSGDFVTWVPICTNTISVCHTLRFSDQTEGDHMFYRTTEVKP